jgi:hypothetical protein
MENKYAHIAVFGFNRPNHLAACLKSLSLNPESKKSAVTIFIDGPRAPQDLQMVEATRDVAFGEFGFLSKEVVVRETNLGLAKSITTGVNHVLADNTRIIVLEDDLWLSTSFLKFMNQGLSLYENEPRVASLHGFCFQFAKPLDQPFFLRGADCLGWATWKDRWETVNFNASELLQEIESLGLSQQFNLDGAFSYTTLLKAEIGKEKHSWAILWHASMFLQNKLTLYPGESLIRYEGADGSGINSGTGSLWDTTFSKRDDWEFPREISESYDARDELVNFYRVAYPKRNFFSRVIRKLIRSVMSLIK